MARGRSSGKHHANSNPCHQARFGIKIQRGQSGLGLRLEAYVQQLQALKGVDLVPADVEHWLGNLKLPSRATLSSYYRGAVIMTNLTISVDAEVLKRARIRALEENTSINAVLAQYLVHYARLDDSRRQRQAALEGLLTLAEHSQAGRGESVWTRDALHER
ncbi:conserved hypothetical protein [Candidatus Competibacter denitrificans Run_A_D11]|uniref:Uncharacterized protein n=1 Tax=Candidatus Competibacter denitrificans Run_A_D11 TaxID=1400863 RepID=W6MBE4_9GAMM|nr:hypothetical protein [Candidatus Competibacter denitrificans]CDI03445.1 conserved hypothetical protein [Candidatus Competibacter denitrificans Run_A_D11]HAS85533.1 hypothetical protein [Candidatus Competibacteraceae bacterium]HRC69614.1 hypothetical protein [Candidatus Competibacter denitrificans]